MPIVLRTLCTQDQASRNLKQNRDVKARRCQKNGDDDYAALDKITRRLNQLVPMAKQNNRDDETKVRYLTKDVVGTPWGLAALQQTPIKKSYQIFINALYTSMRASGTFKSEPTSNLMKRKMVFKNHCGKHLSIF